MVVSKSDLEDKTDRRPPDVPAEWLTEVANLTFYLAWDRARSEYIRKCGKIGLFEKLPSNEKSKLCANAMDELIREGYTGVYDKEILDRAIEMQLNYYNTKDKLRRLWSDEPEQP